MLSFSDLKDLRDILSHPYYVPHPAKLNLIELLEDVLELKGKESPEEAIAILKDKIRNELKSEMKQKIGKLGQLEKENKDLQTKKDEAERLNKALEYASNTAKNENIELKAETNKLNTQIQQLQQKKKILEVKNEETEQLREKATYIANASTVLTVGLATYIALEHTTKLDIWLMVGIAIVSALVAGYVTHTTLRPNTQVNESKEVQINCKRQNLISTSHIHLTEC